ncbi:MAG: ABC transporter ATP-binding protein [Deltaproteobacteria bacterium]|nr:ABC transporter ATP-binding protein [Deltaproteobacteria bacterium]MBM4323321.1 ABC transporter ATP-binding protein [Deltaproteobacteria bacterium]
MLTIDNLKKHFGSVKAVDHVNLKITEGEIVSIIGTNGAGKTTLVNLISGYIKPDSGRILFLDKDITYASPYIRIKLGVGRSFQLIQLFSNCTVLDNVRTALFSKYGMIRRGLLPADRYASVTDEAIKILDSFSMSDKKNLTPKGLSEGDLKILDIAIAFALKSKLLLLDEPTSGVATNDKFKVMDSIVKAIKKERISTLIIEHDMDIVSGYSDRVVVMHEGKVIAEGKPNEVMENKEVKATVFGIVS